MPKIGFKHTKYSKEKMRLAAKKRKPNFLGKHHSEETKKKLREARLRQKDPALGHKVSDELKEYYRRLFKGKRFSKRTEFKKGQKPWNYGKRGPRKPIVRKPQPVSYFVLHSWLKYHYGKPLKCENPNCFGKSKFYHWAKVRGKEYKKIRENFIQLCASCHQLYDKNLINLWIKQ